MTDEELTFLEIREDRRLVELGIDPDTDPAMLLLMLEKLTAEAKAEQDAKCCKP